MIAWLLSQDWPSLLVGVEAALAVVVVALDVRETLGYQRRWAKAAGEDPRYWFIRPVRRIGAFITLLGVWLIALLLVGLTGFTLADNFPWIRPINGALFVGLLAIPWLTGRALRSHVAGADS